MDSGLLSHPETGSLDEPSEPMSWTVWRKAEELYSFYPGIGCGDSMKWCKCLSNLILLLFESLELNALQEKYSIFTSPEIIV